MPTAHSIPSWFRAGARVRGVGTGLGVVALFAGMLCIVLAPETPDALPLALCFGGFFLLMIGLALTLWPGGPQIASRPIGVPASAGRWTAINSPANRVPSHGTHGHGQTFAIDLVYDPGDGSRPEFSKGPAFRPPDDYPGFGRELLAPADGRVVAVRDDMRDHRSRSTWPATST